MSYMNEKVKALTYRCKLQIAELKKKKRELNLEINLLINKIKNLENQVGPDSIEFDIFFNVIAKNMKLKQASLKYQLSPYKIRCIVFKKCEQFIPETVKLLKANHNYKLVSLRNIHNGKIDYDFEAKRKMI